ncbi:prominin-1 [Anopheles nili]|uniref:prominin-1 n=1 Tax=Anopheles nili TaxID=185578 RepID=UPI00237B374F|nr:prominin-1 [Anopheles nili]
MFVPSGIFGGPAYIQCHQHTFLGGFGVQLGNGTEVPVTVPHDYPEPVATEDYVIPTLGLYHGSFVFAYLSTFLSYITPYELPVVYCLLELLRDAFHTKVSFLHLILEALKVESGYICLIAIFFLISLIPLCYTIAWGCAKEPDDDLNPGPTVDAIMQAEELSLEESLHCRKSFLALMLQVVMLLLIAGVIAMFVTNEQIASAVDQTPAVVRASLLDVATFLRDAEQQIRFVITEGLATATERIRDDLESVDKLLGEPIQHHLALFTGIDIIFESIIEISTSSSNLSRRIHLLQDALARAAKISYEAEYRLDELQIQLSVLQRQCTFRDRPLCDTLRIRNFEDTGLIERIRKLQVDRTLAKLMAMGEAGRNSSMHALTQELTLARATFRNYATDVRNVTEEQADRVHERLEELTGDTLATTGVLTHAVGELIEQVNRTSNFSDSFFDRYREIGAILWLAGLATTIMTLLVTLILLSALSCGCCHADSKAGITLILGAVCICIASLALSGFAMMEMLLGAHGQVFLCQPLYDAPGYSVLQKLIDKPGLIYPVEPQHGIIGELLRQAAPPNASWTRPIQVSLSTALNKCEDGHGSYATFQLDALLNLSAALEHHQRPELERAIESVAASEEPFVGFTARIQTILEDMLFDSDLNLTGMRMELTQLSPDKDVLTFIDQLQRVSAQIQDVATSSRMTTLGSRAKRLQLSLLAPLEQLRGDIVYHLTALELQLSPWAAQVNKSLTHLRNAQAFLDSDAAEVCYNRSDLYRDRLRAHLDAYRNYTAVVLRERCASCRPLFDIFDAMRMLFCHHIMDPMNGLWFSAFLCLFLWAVATPLSLMLSSTYRRIDVLSSKLQHSNSNRYNARASVREDQRESSHWSTQRSVSVHVNAVTESSTDEDLPGMNDSDPVTEDGAVVIEYIELRYENGDPTNYAESLI